MHTRHRLRAHRGISILCARVLSLSEPQCQMELAAQRLVAAGLAYLLRSASLARRRGAMHCLHPRPASVAITFWL